MFRLGLCVFVLAGFVSVCAATDGSASLTFNLVSPGGTFAPRHVTGVWVSDATDHFIKTLLLQANTRKGYLYQWNAARGSETRVDGVSTATTTSYGNPALVTWNLRDYDGVLRPDGQYRFHVEFTDKNAQGPYTPPSYLEFTKGVSDQVVTPANLTYITGLSINYDAVPEPASLCLLAGGALLASRRRRR